MTNVLWGVFPYVAFTLFFAVPVIRMVFRPYSFTTRASGLFNRTLRLCLESGGNLRVA